MTDSSHQTVIQKNRVFLVKSIDLTKTAILDHLVQEKVLSVEQLMAIKTTCTTNLQTVSNLLNHLHSRTPEDWSTFLKCLTDNEHGHVVDALKAAVTGHPGLPLVGLQQKMAGIILQLYDKVPMWTLHSDLCRVPMEQLYVDLVLVKDKQHKLGKEEHLQGYKDLFRKPRRRSTIYLCGEPGVGKSTFTQHLCVEWAKIHDQGEVQGQTDDTFDNYSFVLPLFLRDVKIDQTLSDVMAESYQLGQREAEELYHHINNPEEPVLIIADGLDEYSDGTSEEITKLLLRQILPHITLFITSRFSPETFSTETKLRPDTEVALRGFTEVGVKEYLLKFFNQNKEKRDALIKEIEKSDELVHLSHCPAMLLMMATLGEENQQLPSTITGFYEEFVAYVFARMEKRNLEKVADRAKSTEEILRRYNTQIMALGCLATGNVKTHKLELKFKQEDVDKHISSEDLNSGFLIQKLSFSREIFYIFIHKTVQEYFLSFYLVHSDKSTQQELLLRFFNSRQAFMESAMIRRFVSGLGGWRIHRQLEDLIDGSERQVAKMHTDLQLEYLAEHQDATLTLPRGVGLDIDNRYPASHYVRYLSQDGGEVRKVWVRTGGVRHWRLLQHLHAPQLTCLQLDVGLMSTCSVDKQYITQTLDRTLTKFTLKQLTVFGDLFGYIDDNEASAVVRAVVHSQTLQQLSFFMTPLTGDRIQTLTEWLPGCHLTSLEMSGCKLTSQEMMAALSVLPPSLQTLNVRGKDLTGLTDTGQLSGVTRSQIQTLNMSDCRLASRGVLAVIDAAPETLTDLDVSYNCREGEGDDLVKVAERTTQLTKLKILNLERNNMSRDVVTTIKQKLTETCPHLELRIDKQSQRW